VVRYERQLTTTSIGSLWVGRLISGNEAGRSVLLRRVQRQTFTDKELESLLQGAAAYSKVRHPALVKLLGVVEQDADVVTVSEHLVGVSLLDVLRQSFDDGTPIPATVAVRIMLDAARAMAKAHHLAVDAGLFPSPRISLPDGIFIAAFGGTLLTEVGTLAILANTSSSRAIPDVVAQLAPEELEDAPSSLGSPEVFSLGVLLWQCLANRWLFSLDSASGTRDEVRGRSIPSLNSVERFGMPVPRALVTIVENALERDPARRYPTLDAFISALEQLPQHFIATEHQVAELLRQQTPSALQQCASDEAAMKTSGTFSEVPPSRISTRPPAAPISGNAPAAFGEESPTFAQRKLVTVINAGGSAQDGWNTTLATTEPPRNRRVHPSSFSAHARSLSGYAVSERRPNRRATRTAIVLGLLFLSAAAVGSVLWQRHRTAEVRTDPASVSGPRPAMPLHPGPQAPVSEDAKRSDPQRASNVAPDTSSPEMTRPTPRQVDGTDVTAPLKTNQENRSSTPTLDSPATTSGKRNSNAFRPREIAPYRPTGI
jgi:hypothetical protein